MLLCEKGECLINKIKIKQFETVLKLVINGTHLLRGLRSDAFSCNNIPSI